MENTVYADTNFYERITISKYRTFDNKEQSFEEILNFLKWNNVTKVAFEATARLWCIKKIVYELVAGSAT